jgi:hypothetical protein
MRDRGRPSPAMAVAVIALVVAMSGLAWAGTRSGTSQLANKAVTSNKLARGAVTTGKLSSGAVNEGKIGAGAVDSAQLAQSASGVALVGAFVDGQGNVVSAFSRISDLKPTVYHPQPGEYTLVFPLLDNGEDRVESGLPVGTLQEPGQITVGYALQAGSINVYVRTYDESWQPADRRFYYLFFGGTRLPVR